jgi:hypothetical protein
MAQQKELEKMTYIALGVVFWVVLLILLWAIILHYAFG